MDCASAAVVFLAGKMTRDQNLKIDVYLIMLRKLCFLAHAKKSAVECNMHSRRVYSSSRRPSICFVVPHELAKST